MLANQSSQPKKILLAVDGSEHSLAAAQFVHDLPLPLGSRICILSVLIPREAGLKTYALEHFMEQVSQMLQDKGAEISTHLIAGNPAMDIVREAKEVGADMIVMGAKGLRATLGILLGGVAQQVVEYSGEPVMIVRAPYTGMRKILLVVDGSLQSMDAVHYLTQFPFSQEAEVQVLHVMPPMPSTEMVAQTFPGITEGVYYPIPEDLDTLERLAQEEKEKGEELLRNTQMNLETNGIFAKANLLRGDAATEIIEFTKQNQMDLVVAGSRGLGGFEGWMLGSVSRKLVHYAGCSVLLVKS